MRLIFTDQDLSGQIIDASKRLEGHARQAYLGKCDLRGAKIIGDIRGSDILNSQCEGLDLSEAQTYGCQWTGSTFDAATVIPTDAYPDQPEILLEILRRAAARTSVPVSDDTHALIEAFAMGRFPEAYDLGRKLASTSSGLRDLGALDLGRFLTHYPRLLVHVKSCWENAMMEKLGEPMPSQRHVQWGDGVTVLIDGDKLPPLPRPDDRYELNRWIEWEAGPIRRSLSVTERHVWTIAIRPKFSAVTLTHADEWMTL